MAPFWPTTGRPLPRGEFEAEAREFVTQTELRHYCPVCHEQVFAWTTHYRWDEVRDCTDSSIRVGATFLPCGHREGDPSLSDPLPAALTEEPTPHA